MAVKPPVVQPQATADVVNAILNSGSEQMRAIPVRADLNTPDSMRQIGGYIMQYQALQNEFVSALVNRIVKVLVSSKLYQNPWSMFKRGYLEFGETIEEIFVNIAKAHDYNPAVAEKEWMKREFPDVLSAFHYVNYEKFYKATIQQGDLRKAFLSWDGVNDLIARIVDSLYSGANRDEFLTMKYMIARNILDGYFYGVPQGTTPQETVELVQGYTNLLPFGDTAYNPAGVFTYTMPEDLFIIVNARYLAKLNVEVLAMAFNMDKVEFMGHVIAVDSFGSLDLPRLNELLGSQPGYVAPTTDELQLLDNINVVMVDRNYWMVYDYLNEFREDYNGEGLYWQYWYHQWKMFSTSPFANAIAFTPGEGEVVSVTIIPNAITVAQSFVGNIPFQAKVQTVNFASSQVNWEIITDLTAYPNVVASISSTGVLTITHPELPTSYPPSIQIRATSVADPTKSATATVTLQAP